MLNGRTERFANLVKHEHQGKSLSWGFPFLITFQSGSAKSAIRVKRDISRSRWTISGSTSSTFSICLSVLSLPRVIRSEPCACSCFIPSVIRT